MSSYDLRIVGRFTLRYDQVIVISLSWNQVKRMLFVISIHNKESICLFFVCLGTCFYLVLCFVFFFIPNYFAKLVDVFEL